MLAGGLLPRSKAVKINIYVMFIKEKEKTRTRKVNVSSSFKEYFIKEGVGKWKFVINKIIL